MHILLAAAVLLQAMYYTLTALWGLGRGAKMANVLAVVHDFCGVEQLAVLWGLQLCAQGTGAFIGAPLSGK